MKKILFVSLILCLCLGIGVSFAEFPQSENVVDIGGNYGSVGTTPPTKILRVRYAMQQANAMTISSGDVVIWDTTSKDGLTISACVTDNASNYAGVLVTSIPTADNISQVNQNTRNWGYMAVQGYALAKVDTSNAATGGKLYVNGGTLARSFGTVELAGVTAGSVSYDIGVLLSDTTVDGIMPVWLQ